MPVPMRARGRPTDGTPTSPGFVIGPVTVRGIVATGGTLGGVVTGGGDEMATVADDDAEPVLESSSTTLAVTVSVWRSPVTPANVASNEQR